jgi:hypothetical protein
MHFPEFSAIVSLSSPVPINGGRLSGRETRLASIQTAFRSVRLTLQDCPQKTFDAAIDESSCGALLEMQAYSTGIPWAPTSLDGEFWMNANGR